MSELSDLLGGLLGSEAGKDSGGMDGLFDLLGRADAVRSIAEERTVTGGTAGCESPPDTADFEAHPAHCFQAAG